MIGSNCRNIIIALIIISSILIYVEIIDRYNVPDEWDHFIRSSIIYIVAELYFVFYIKLMRNEMADPFVIGILVIFTIGPIVVLYILFSYGIIKMPSYSMPYLIGIPLLLPVPPTIIEIYLKRKKNTTKTTGQLP